MDLNAEIISGKSLANISIGTSIDRLLSVLRNDKIPHVQSQFVSFNRRYELLTIFGGVVAVAADEARIIRRLSAGIGYIGRCKRGFHPGMTVKEVCDKSTKQLVVHGMIVMDGDFGIFFDVPETHQNQHYDDIDSIKQLPREMVLSELHVMHPEWWREPMG